MKSLLRRDLLAGDGVGIERSTDDGKYWEKIGHINTGATGSTLQVSQDIVDRYNNTENANIKKCI